MTAAAIVARVGALPARYAPHLFAATVCFGLAIANAARAPGPVAVLAAAAALTAAIAGRRARVGFAVALLLAAWWWASVRLDALDRTALRAHAGEHARAVVVVTGPTRKGAFALRMPGRVRRFGRLVLDERVLLELPLGRAPPQGAILQVVAGVELPRPPEAGFDERAWLRRQGIHVVLQTSHWRQVGRRGGVAGWFDRLREQLSETIAPGLRGNRRAVVAGIVLGDDERLSRDLRDAFEASGLYHLLAVSGQNVAFLAGGIVGFAWLVGLPRRFAECGVLLAIAGYVAAVGWQPSVVRAGVAGSLASLAWLAARPRDRWYFLLLGAIVLLAWNPYSLLEPGFQLSFAAVGAIFVAVPFFRRFLDGYPVPRWLADVVAVSAACGAVTAPILWLHFGAVPVFSILSNALAAPVVGPLLGLGLVSAAVEPVLPPLAFALAWGNGWLAAYLGACARLVAALPHAQITSWTALAVAVAAVAGPVALYRLRGRARWALVGGAVLAACVALAWRLVPEGLPPPAGLRITFLDVGQGDAVLVQTRTANVLVDQGPPEGNVAAQLRRLGVERLSLLVLTHPQRDHVGGAADVLSSLDVATALDPAIPADSPDERAALAAARARRVPVLLARAGRRYRLGALRLRVLWPEDGGPRGEDPNERATVLLVSYGEVDALLTADAEAHITSRLRPSPVEILKVAHHGSADPLLPTLLRLVRPRVAVISVGENNDYSHPAPSTLRALAGVRGLRVYRTDIDGRVTVEAERTRFEVRTAR